MLVDYNVGSILSGGTDNPPANTGRGRAELYNTVQRYAIEHSRLHVPILYAVDAVHGLGHPTDATLVPHRIGLGAPWDPDLARQTGDAVRRQLMAVGTRWNFAPVQDVERDNRWGRYRLSYTSFALSGLAAPSSVRARGDMTATNTGERADTEVVQAYAQQPTTHDSAVAPSRRLVVTLDPGQSRRVEVPIALQALTSTPGDIESTARPHVQPGAYRLAVGDLAASFAITG